MNQANHEVLMQELTPKEDVRVKDIKKSEQTQRYDSSIRLFTIAEEEKDYTGR